MAPAVAEARPAPSPGDGGSAFARALAAGGQKQRDAALAALSRWLASRSEVDETEMLKLWKGLFYAMWHADKPAVQARRPRAPSQPFLASRPTCAYRDAPQQADVAERMASVLDSSKPEARRRRSQPQLSAGWLLSRIAFVAHAALARAGGVGVLSGLLYYATVRAAAAQRRGQRRAAPQRPQADHCAVVLRSRDWFVIDRLRLDKYMVLVRKVLHHLFACLQRHRWCVCARTAAAAAVAAHSAARAPPAQGARDAGLCCPVPRGEGAHGASQPTLVFATLRFASAPFRAASRSRAHHVTQATERECALGLSLHAIDVFLPALAASAPPPSALAPLLRPFVTVLAHAGASCCRLYCADCVEWPASDRVRTPRRARRASCDC